MSGRLLEAAFSAAFRDLTLLRMSGRLAVSSPALDITTEPFDFMPAALT